MTFVSFLRLQLQPSAVSRGLAYELLVLRVLKSYSFQLVHTGRAGDRGQDFFGHWQLPDRRVQVIGQYWSINNACIHSQSSNKQTPLAHYAAILSACKKIEVVSLTLHILHF